jgi:hypothetical protein
MKLFIRYLLILNKLIQRSDTNTTFSSLMWNFLVYPGNLSSHFSLPIFPQFRHLSLNWVVTGPSPSSNQFYGLFLILMTAFHNALFHQNHLQFIVIGKSIKRLNHELRGYHMRVDSRGLLLSLTFLAWKLFVSWLMKDQKWDWISSWAYPKKMRIYHPCSLFSY